MMKEKLVVWVGAFNQNSSEYDITNAAMYVPIPQEKLQDYSYRSCLQCNGHIYFYPQASAQVILYGSIGAKKEPVKVECDHHCGSYILFYVLPEGKHLTENL